MLLGGASLGLLPACDDKKEPSTAASGSPSSAPTAANSDKEFQIGWSVWTGWMPFKLMAEKGFLKKRADEHKVKIKLVEFKGYMDSVQAFAAKKLDGCAMTSMESLQPASNGVPSVAILIVLIALGIAPTLTNDIALAGRGVPQSAVVKAYTLGASTTEVAFKVIFPQILPRILDSIRLTIGPAWIFLIASEAISADSGLGYRIYVVQRQLAMNVILPYVLWIALLGVVMDYVIAAISRWGFPWAHDRGGH